MIKKLILSFIVLLFLLQCNKSGSNIFNKADLLLECNKLFEIEKQASNLKEFNRVEFFEKNNKPNCDNKGLLNFFKFVTQNTYLSLNEVYTYENNLFKVFLVHFESSDKSQLKEYLLIKKNKNKEAVLLELKDQNMDSSDIVNYYFEENLFLYEKNEIEVKIDFSKDFDFKDF